MNEGAVSGGAVSGGEQWSRSDQRSGDAAVAAASWGCRTFPLLIPELVLLGRRMLERRPVPRGTD